MELGVQRPKYVSLTLWGCILIASTVTNIQCCKTCPDSLDHNKYHNILQSQPEHFAVLLHLQCTFFVQILSSVWKQ